MPRPLRMLALLCALVALPLAVAACGSSVPVNGVASVDGQAVTKADFNHWLTIAVKSSQAQGGGAVVPDPPKYTKCIAALKKTTPPPPKGKKGPSDETFRKQCAAQYKQLSQQVVQFLVTAKWLQGEAKKRGVEVTDAQVEKQFEKTKKQAFPNDKGDKKFKQFLKTSGETKADLLFRVKVDLLQTKLREAVVKGKDKVTRAQIAKYYAKHKSQFAQPERRDLQIILTKTKAKADAAKAALDSGQSWKDVVKKYSIDVQTKPTGGLLAGVTKGQQDAALDKVAFSAPKGKLEGPIKAQFGWYLVKVKAITKASQQSLAQATPTIRQLLASQNQQTALNNFIKDFQSEWRKKTTCRKQYQVATLCGNAPKPKTSTTPSTTPNG